MLHKLKKFLVSEAPQEPALPYNHVDLYHWSPNDGRVNFGDRLSKIIVEKLLSTKSLTLDDEVITSRRMLGIGSILHFSQDGDTIWGSGVNGKIAPEAFNATRLDIRAVRGPLTRNFLLERNFEVPEIYGDPGLLTAHLFGDRFRKTEEKDYVFVPNFHDLKLVQGQPHVISPLLGWNKVITEILKARFVLASSLHGLVIAESFGIPARYVRLTETEGLFKYKDYVYGSGRSNFEYASSIEEGLEMKGMPPIHFDANQLINAFPWEFWR